GTVSGTTTLDSIWTDLRLRDADLTHRDGADSPPSRVRGTARVTLGDDFVTIDATGTAQPLAATTLAKSYPMLLLRGDYRGPIRVVGTVADLAVSTDLVGEGGRLQLDGRFDMYEPTYRAVAAGTMTGLDFRKAFGMEHAPASAFDGRFAV